MNKSDYLQEFIKFLREYKVLQKYNILLRKNFGLHGKYNGQSIEDSIKTILKSSKYTRKEPKDWLFSCINWSHDLSINWSNLLHIWSNMCNQFAHEETVGRNTLNLMQ